MVAINRSAPTERREDLTNYELNSKHGFDDQRGHRIEASTIAVVINRKRFWLRSARHRHARGGTGADQRGRAARRARAAGVDVKRGDQQPVSWPWNSRKIRRTADGFDTASLIGPLIGLATGLVKGGTVLGLVLDRGSPWPQARHTRTALTRRRLRQLAGLWVLSDRGGNRRRNRRRECCPHRRCLFARRNFSVSSRTNPTLSKHITSDVLRLSQRRLEQMVALDEEQAANVLKAWTAGTRSMTALPVADYLRDLNGDLPRGPRCVSAGGDSESDIEQRLEEAYIRGVLEGRAAAQSEYGEKIQRQTEVAENISNRSGSAGSPTRPAVSAL